MARWEQPDLADSAVVHRLTLYHGILMEYLERNIEFISSPQIAGRLGIDDSQVRKDLKWLDSTGICKVGYPVAALQKAIESTLGFAKSKKAVIVGAGNLGLALTKYDNFARYGIDILALFDNDPLKVGLRTINGKQVFHIAELSELVKNGRVDVAILTVPGAAAQELANLLVASGITHLWNFTQRLLLVPEGVKVWNENLIGNFIEFTMED